MPVIKPTFSPLCLSEAAKAYVVITHYFGRAEYNSVLQEARRIKWWSLGTGLPNTVGYKKRLADVKFVIEQAKKFAPSIPIEVSEAPTYYGNELRISINMYAPKLFSTKDVLKKWLAVVGSLPPIPPARPVKRPTVKSIQKLRDKQVSNSSLLEGVLTRRLRQFHHAVTAEMDFTLKQARSPTVGAFQRNIDSAKKRQTQELIALRDAIDTWLEKH